MSQCPLKLLQFTVYKATYMQILKKFFSACHIIKIPLNGLNDFTRFTHFFSPFQGSEKYV